MRARTCCAGLPGRAYRVRPALRRIAWARTWTPALARWADLRHVGGQAPGRVAYRHLEDTGVIERLPRKFAPPTVARVAAFASWTTKSGPSTPATSIGS